jgi:MtrB/PioB family decaheme-associated outer membrane protein
MALPPDNQAHQLSATGYYAFTPTTRTTFKLAKTHATQHDNFAGMGLGSGPAGISDLGGVMDTTLAQFGLTAQPADKLSLLANLRYEDKDDKTPLNLYGVNINRPILANGGVQNITNSPSPLTKLDGKLEASYRLPSSYRATLGFDYATVNRGVPTSSEYLGGLALLREETRELGWRAELKRSMSETLNAGISYVNSRRDGSSWLGCTAGVKGCTPISDAVAASSALYGSGQPHTSFMLMDRARDKIKLSADWLPTEKLSMQFLIEDGRDKYSEPHNTSLIAKSLNDTGTRLISIDATLALSDMWKLTGYVSQGEQTMHMNHAAYLGDIENINTSIGLGMRGKPSGKLEVGGDLSYINDKNHYGQGYNGTAIPGLPDVIFRQTTLKLFGKYALDKNADVRVDFVQQRTKLNEWTWENGNGGTPFFYSDYTTVSMKQTQNVAFIAATYIYKFK